MSSMSEGELTRYMEEKLVTDDRDYKTMIASRYGGVLSVVRNEHSNNANLGI